MFLKQYLKYLPLPLLVAAYPVLFLFGHNTSILNLNALVFPMSASLLLAGVIYTLFCLFLQKPLLASLSVNVFIAFYYLYGSIDHLVMKWNQSLAQSAVLLPLVVVLALALGALATRIKRQVAIAIHKILLVVSAGLILYNLFAVTVPAEAQKALANRSPFVLDVPVTGGAANAKPDIYYIIFDEYSGFETIRNYWHQTYGEQFKAFLQQNGFFVATGSRSVTLNTGAEIATRLNLQPYSTNLADKVKQNAIDNNKVMAVMKAYGYTTVAIDMFFPGIHADQTVQYNPKDAERIAADAFEKLFLDMTMLNPFSEHFQSSNQTAVKQRDMILYSLDKTVEPGKIPSPKFVYTHILLPHEPFIFDKDCNLLPTQAHDDWNYYLGQHQCATQLAEQLIVNLLAQADPNNPPVIILQSDHGARNLPTLAADGTTLNHLLPNFPIEKGHDILNALYLPGFDTSQLSNTMDPTETFAIVLNHYLNVGLKVNRTPIQ